MQRHRSRPKIPGGRRRRPKRGTAIPTPTLQSSNPFSQPLAAATTTTTTTTSTSPLIRTAASSIPTMLAGGLGLDMSELTNALKKRGARSRHKNTPPPALRMTSSLETKTEKTPSVPIVFTTFGAKKNKKTPLLSQKLSRVASFKGFKRLKEPTTHTHAAPPRTPRVPVTSTSTITNTAAASTKKAWETGDIRWVKVVDHVTGDGDNYVVAKFKNKSGEGRTEKMEFEKVDWKLDDGTLVNDTSIDTDNNESMKGATFKVKATSVGPRIETPNELNQFHADMVNLSVVHEATVLHNLKQRYMRSHFMTNIGSILIVLNPFEYMSELYGLDVVRRYTDGNGQVNQDLPPHVYKLAQTAYRNLIRMRQNQAIIIAGESGAGKTESTKKCLQYLAEVGGSSFVSTKLNNTSNNQNMNNNQNNNNTATTTISVEDRILSANPVFEAFGNASTVRNKNSSRFGKWLELIFDPSTFQLVGCQTIQYLLEKSRVNQIAPGERNFSIFYQLLAGADDDLLTELKLPSREPSSYTYLNICDISTESVHHLSIAENDHQTMTDRDNFAMTMDAMHSLNFQSCTTHILSVVAAILHIGNIDIVENDDGNACIHNRVPLIAAADCLSCDIDELCLALTCKRLIIVGERTNKPLAVHAAVALRDAIAKGLYNQLFAVIVNTINQSMKASISSMLKIGILDIFGFEIFENNSIEQLCINFANEKLQMLFNQSVVEDEVQTCKEEGIEIPAIEFKIDSGIVALFEQKTPLPGIMLMLDEEVRIVGGTDIGWMRKIIKNYGMSNLITDRPPRKIKKSKDKKIQGKDVSCFWISHYAGIVKYQANGFLQKNIDDVPTALSEVVQSSKIAFIASLFPKEDADLGKGAGGRRQGNRRKNKKKTLLGQFRSSLSSLIRSLKSSSPHYIRCIKTNSLHQPKVFHAGLVSRQLSCSGLHDVVRLRKEGYSYRLGHQEFVKRFFPLLRWQARKKKNQLSKVVSMRTMKATRTSDEQAHDIIEVLSQIYPNLDQECVVGKTKVLIREMPYQWLERYLDVVRDRASRLVQKTARGRKSRNRVNVIRSSKNILKTAIEKGDLQKAQELLQIARKRMSNQSETLLFREVLQIESMLQQSRSKRQLSEMIKSPLCDLWTQRQLLQSLVAEARTGDVVDDESRSIVLKKAVTILSICTEMEESVKKLDTAILSQHEQQIQDAITTVETLSKLHGNYCVVSLNSAKSRLCKKQVTASPAFIPKTVVVREITHEHEVDDPSNQTARRTREREKIAKRRQHQKKLALESLVALQDAIERDDTQQTMISRLAEVVTVVEMFANNSS